MNFFEKPLDAVTTNDLDWLIENEVQEGREIDFKREPPGEKNEPDPWQKTGEKINGAAVAALVKELVAFANANGGTIILGMEETEEGPPRAKAVNPIRDCLPLGGR